MSWRALVCIVQKSFLDCELQCRYCLLDTNTAEACIFHVGLYASFVLLFDRIFCIKAARATNVNVWLHHRRLKYMERVILSILRFYTSQLLYNILLVLVAQEVFKDAVCFLHGHILSYKVTLWDIKSQLLLIILYLI